MNEPRKSRRATAWVGVWLHKERERAGLTIDQVAERLGIHPSSVVRRENGTASISADDMPKVTKAYRTTLQRYADAGQAVRP